MNTSSMDPRRRRRANCVAAVLLVLASAVNVHARRVACGPSPIATGDELCGQVGSSPCTISDTVELDSTCNVDFGERAVTITGRVTADVKPVQSELYQFTGGTLTIRAEALTVGCTGALLAPGSMAADGGDKNRGGRITLDVDGDLTVAGTIAANGANSGGIIKLRPAGALLIDATSTGAFCPSLVEAGTTRGLVQANGRTRTGEAWGGGIDLGGRVGGTSPPGDGSDPITRATTVAVVGGGVVEANGNKRGSGGQITGAACGPITVDAQSSLSAVGAGENDDDAWIMLAAPTIDVAGTLRSSKEIL